MHASQLSSEVPSVVPSVVPSAVPSAVPSVVPLDLYRHLIGLLNRDEDTWDDTLWLRFAAQVAVMCPESPPTLVRRIREIAEQLLHHAPWYHALASPARFVVAAMLIQQRIPVADFVSEHAHVISLMDVVGLRHEQFCSVVAVLMLMMTPGHRSATIADVERIKAIYGQMKGFHWWQTGPNDVPACVALAQCYGSADLLVGRVEYAYQDLMTDGVLAGRHLQTAANLLPLVDLELDHTLQRYRGLVAALVKQNGSFDQSYYDALALLTMLDHRPELVICRLVAITGELDRFQPECEGDVNILIASDLVFLDLIRSDYQQKPIIAPDAVAKMLRTFHAFQLGSAVLVSQIDSTRVQFIGNANSPAWPYQYPFL